jgi:hypothetical protein
MGAMVGMVIGYVLGARAGERGFEELEASWETISSSQEVRDMLVGGPPLGAVMLRRGRGMLADRLQLPEDRGLRVA